MVFLHFHCVEKLEKVPFYKKDSGIFRLNKNVISLFAYHSGFPVVLRCPAVDLAGSLQKDFRTLSRGSPIIRSVSYISLKGLCTQLCGMLLSTCAKWAHIIHSDPTYISYYLSTCGSQTTAGFVFRFISSHSDANDPYPAEFLPTEYRSWMTFYTISYEILYFNACHVHFIRPYILIKDECIFDWNAGNFVC